MNASVKLLSVYQDVRSDTEVGKECLFRRLKTAKRDCGRFCTIPAQEALHMLTFTAHLNLLRTCL